MLLLPPVHALYEEMYPADVATYFEPPRDLVEEYWDWGERLAGPSVPVHTARPVSTLRDVAKEKNAERALLQSAITRLTAMRTGAVDGPRIALSNAFADLAVTGRAAFFHFRQIRPTEDTLLSAMMSSVRTTIPGVAEAEARQALRLTLDRAYTVIWALTGPPTERQRLRPTLGWIAISGEDDAPYVPVNIPATADPMWELPINGLGQSITCRMSIKLPDAAPATPGMDVAMRTFPIETWHQFNSLLVRPEFCDDIILFVHGLGSRIEEGERFKQRLIDHGKSRGKRFAVLSIDLPGFGYSSRLDFDAVVNSHPANFDLENPRHSSFPFLTLFRDALEKVSMYTGNRIRYAVGGSLGGNLVLRLAETRRDGTYILPDSLLKFFSWSPASIWESYARAVEFDLNPNDYLFYDHIKHEMVRISRDHMNLPDNDNTRNGWFDYIQRGVWVGPFRAGGWVPKSGVTREMLLYLAEIYGEAWRRTHWATTHEQLIFSHQEPMSFVAGNATIKWPFQTINRPLYILSGEKDVHHPLQPINYYDNVDKVTRESPDVPGRRMLLKNTGHSIHDEHPDLLASHAVRFFLDSPTFSTASKIAVVPRGPEQLDVLTIATDGRVYHSAWDGNIHDWSSVMDAWKSIGGFFPTTASISAVSPKDDIINAFCVANDGRVYTSWWVQGVSDWSGVHDNWMNIGGNFPPGGQVAALARKLNTMDLFAVAANGCVYTNWYVDGGSWLRTGGLWRNIGGHFPAGAPLAAVARKPTIIDLFAVGSDGHVYTSWWEELGVWSGLGGAWRNIGGNFPPGAPIAAVAHKPTVIDLFIVGADGCAYTSRWEEGVSDWSGIGVSWQNVGGNFSPGTPLAAVSSKPEQLNLFATGVDGHVYTNWWSQVGGWYGLDGGAWYNLGGVFPPGTPVAAVARKPGQLDLFAFGRDGRMYTNWDTEGRGPWPMDHWRLI